MTDINIIYKIDQEFAEEKKKLEVEYSKKFSLLEKSFEESKNSFVHKKLENQKDRKQITNSEKVFEEISSEAFSNSKNLEKTIDEILSA